MQTPVSSLLNALRQLYFFWYIVFPSFSLNIASTNECIPINFLLKYNSCSKWCNAPYIDFSLIDLFYFIFHFHFFFFLIFFYPIFCKLFIYINNKKQKSIWSEENIHMLKNLSLGRKKKRFGSQTFAQKAKCYVVVVVVVVVVICFSVFFGFILFCFVLFYVVLFCFVLFCFVLLCFVFFFFFCFLFSFSFFF